jgi:hypothetical protein
VATALLFTLDTGRHLTLMHYEPALLRARVKASHRTEPEEGVTIPPTPALLLLLDRLRSRFALRAELLDASLKPVAPAGGDTFSVAVAADTESRRRALAVLKSGLPEVIAVAADRYHVQPLRARGRSGRIVGLLAIAEAPSSASRRGGDTTMEAWTELLRVTLEADLGAASELREERLDARRVLAVLRFVAQILRYDEDEMTRAVIHAAAVWFDVDARIYRRTLIGDYLVHLHLPGTEVPVDAQLPAAVVPPPGQSRRIEFADLPEDLRWSAGDLFVTTLATADESDWVLVLAGELPTSAEPLVAALAQALGAQLAKRGQREIQDATAALHRIIVHGETLDSTALDLLRELIALTGAAAGSVTLHEQGGTRRLAVHGSARPVTSIPVAPLLATDQLVHPMPLGGGRTAVIDLRADTPFTVDAGPVLMAAGRLVHGWLAGADAALRADNEPQHQLARAGFSHRIAEELERAKRFDLGLSMVVIDLDGRALEGATIDRLLAAVRAELRGSDLLGVLDDKRIAALLVHTDANGVGSVLPRLRRRVGELAQSLGVPFPRLGRAVFSDECRTASSLLSCAMQNLEAIQQGR